MLKDKQTEQNPALSQVQALAQSVCKQKSGDRMSCMSCHDPHSSPTSQERVAFYRAKCLNCHGQSFADRHHPSEPDCTACHMPFTMGTVIAHTQTTDHRILRRPPTQLQLASADNRPDLPHLVPFPDTSRKQDDERELALAWESLAEGGMQSAVSEASRLLQSAAQKYPNDPDLLSALGYIEQRRGNTQQAAVLYRRALKSDPDRIDAAMNLGVIDAQQGQLGDAVELWQRAFEHAPWRSPIGMNLAYAFCSSAQYKPARDYVLRVLEFDPDLDRAKKLLSNLNSDHPNCGP